MARILGFRDYSNGQWFQVHPAVVDAGSTEDLTPVYSSVTDISIQNLDGSNDIFVASDTDWDAVGMVIKPGQIVAFEGLTPNMKLYVNDDGSECQMAIMKIER